MREIRLRAGLTQRRLAAALRVSHQFVSQVERGIRPLPEGKELDAILHALDPKLKEPDESEWPEESAARAVPAPRGPYR